MLALILRVQWVRQWLPMHARVSVTGENRCFFFLSECLVLTCQSNFSSDTIVLDNALSTN